MGKKTSFKTIQTIMGTAAFSKDLRSAAFSMQGFFK